MQRFGTVVLALALAQIAHTALPVQAAISPATPLKLDGWTESLTVDSGTEAMPPLGQPAVLMDDRSPLPVLQAPFGQWSQTAIGADAVGTANCWSTMLAPGTVSDSVISTRFTVIKSSGYARQLPGGCVRWGFHWGENLPGWDVGVVLGYHDPLNFYRVQLSAARGELALWDATGGFLQLIPCKVALGVPHDLAVSWRGAHIVTRLDGKKVMDYWDRTLPYTDGRVGLAVWKSQTHFDSFSVNAARGGNETMPAHKPDFRFEPTENIMTEHPGFHMVPRHGLILFDGYEPISFFWKQEIDKSGEGTRGALTQEGVKLKPGWRATFYTAFGPPGNDGGFPVLQGELPSAFTETAHGKTLGFTFATDWHGKLHTDYNCTVRYDAGSGLYRYEYKAAAKAIATAKFNEFEFFDAYDYNNRELGPEVVHTWNPSGHKWLVYQGQGGAWERVPLTDLLSHVESRPQWGKFADFLYPDAGASPYFENEIDWAQPKGRIYSLGQCNWGYDYHHREAGSPLTMNPGDVRKFSFTFTALTPKQADAVVAGSKLAPAVAADKTVLDPFIPNDDTFAKTVSWQNPVAQMFWEGGTRDETVGHGDHYSLRVDPGQKAGVNLNQYMIEAYAKRWWVRGWVKTKGVGAAGANLRVAYPPIAEDNFKLPAGDTDWTYFSFITSVFTVRDVTKVEFTVPSGNAWIDDVSISALKDDENPPTTGTAIAK